MIFISHTAKDKPLVEPIAEKLSSVFGKENIFYDSRSIQPGDGIINKMDQGLKNCNFFFLFISKNSLQSKFVELEWQNALYKATKGDIKLIPIKMDDCLMPNILLQTMYIDYFGQGSENAIRQIIDVIQGTNTYRPDQVQKFQNIRAHVSEKNKSITIEFIAEVYMEPHSKYFISLDNEEQELSRKAIGESVYGSRFYKDITLCGEQTNGIYIDRDTATSPGFPFIVELNPNENHQINIKGIMRAISRTEYAHIPIIS